MKRFLPGSLRGQLLLLMLLTLAIGQGLSAWLLADEREMALQAALGQEAASRAANVVNLMVEAPQDLRPAIVRAANSRLVRFSLDVTPTVDHRGRDHSGWAVAQIASQIRQNPQPEVRVELRRTSETMQPMAGMPSEMAQMHAAMRDVPVSSVEMTISVAMTDGTWLNVVTLFHDPPYQINWTAFAAFGISAALIVTTLWFALGKFTGPLARLAQATERFGRGENVEEIEPSGPNELQSLTVAFNHMHTRIRRFVDDRTRLLAALSHDLRSPLTALRVRADMIDDDKTRERIIGSTEEMQGMVDSTLAFAQGVSGIEEPETVDVGNFLSDLVAEIKITTPSVALAPFASVMKARVRPTSMRRAFRNIIENAVRYGEHAEIGIAESDGAVVITVDDNGPGIPEAELDRVFDPFVRLETSRSRDTGGTGLGLSIARTIVQSHGGDISLRNREGGGLRATISLPVA